LEFTERVTPLKLENIILNNMSTMILKSLNINLHYKFSKITQYVEIV